MVESSTSQVMTIVTTRKSISGHRDPHVAVAEVAEDDPRRRVGALGSV
jgi:hypothetical protein